MVNLTAWITIIIGTVATIISIIGAIFYWISLKHIKGNESLQHSLLFIAIASYIWITYSTLGFLLLIKNIGLIDNLWLTVAFGHLLTSIAYFVGTLKLESFFKKFM